MLDSSKLKEFADDNFKLVKHFTVFWTARKQILDSSKLKEFADDNFKLVKHFTKFSKRVENTVGKG